VHCTVFLFDKEFPILYIAHVKTFA